MFVHGFPPDILREHLPGRPEEAFYAERALLLARDGDVVCVKRRPHPRYLEDLRELGLGPDPAGIVEVASRAGEAQVDALLRDAKARRPLLDRLAGIGPVALDPYRAGRRECELARLLSDEAGVPVREPCRAPEVVEGADAKDWVRQRALELGLPVAEGEVVDVAGEPGLRGMFAAVERHRSTTGAVLVRAPRASSGFGTFLLDGDASREASRWRAIAARGERRWLVEVLHRVTVSPNVLLHVPRDGAPRVLGISDQRLDSGLSHHGNLHPSSARTGAEMARTATSFAEFLQALGYEGWIGFDLCEVAPPDSDPEHFLAEVNPRVNAALYPLAALERLRRRAVGSAELGGPAAVLATTVATRARTYPALRALLGPLSANRTGGVLPYATAALREGRVALAVIGVDRGAVEALFEEVRKRLQDPAGGA